MGRPTLRDPAGPGWPETGERTTLEDVARRWAQDYMRLAVDGTRDRQLHREKLRQPFDALRDDYLRHRENQYQPSTYYNDRTALTYLSEIARGGGVGRLTRDRLQAFFDGRIERGYAPGGLESLRLSMSAFFRWLGGANPAKLVAVPEVQKAEVHAWTDAEIERIREAAGEVDASRGHKPPSVRRMVELALATGARMQELWALEWRDFNEDAKTVRIVKQANPAMSGVKQLKSKRARTALVLPEWWEYHDASASGWALANEAGNMVSYQTRRLLVDAVLHRAGVKTIGVAAHSFRHTYARRFIELGGRLEELQKSLGHASIRTTEREYGHFHDDVAARLARMRIYGDSPRLVR